MPEPNVLPTRNAKIEEAPLQSELMLFDPEANRFFVLNPTMAFVWKRCDGVHTAAQISQELCGAFEGVEETRAREDIDKALGELRALGLVG